jgi:hypothetical protein
MNEFLNPKSMATPGAAGALMMLLANAISSAFPEVAFRYAALSLSFLIGSVVFAAVGLKRWERGAYWCINSLIIFSMGVGTSNIAANVAASQNGRAALEQAVAAAESLFSTVSGTAHAQEPTRSRPVTSSAGKVVATQKVKELEEQQQALLKEIEQLRQQNQELRQLKVLAPEKEMSMEFTREQKAYEQQGFFKKW